MNATNTNKPTKILVNIWTPLLWRLDARVKAACLKRDQFLDHILRYEANQLRKEVENPNNKLVQRALSTSCSRAETTRVNLYLSRSTAESVTSACKSLNIPRDSFVNRVILFLTASSELVDLLLFSDAEDKWDRFLGYYGEVKQDIRDEEEIAFKASPLDIIADVIHHDPFWFLRAVLKKRHEQYSSCSPYLYDQIINKTALKSVVDSQHLSDLETSDCFFLNCSFPNQNFLNQNSNIGLDLIEDRLSRLSDEREAEKRKLKEARALIKSIVETDK